MRLGLANPRPSRASPCPTAAGIDGRCRPCRMSAAATRARRAALARGVRLDRERSGTSLGDIAAAYAGEIRLDESPLGGLGVVVIWPCHAAT
jgi:hypothetical protein